jgi:hypothetical protein
MKLCKNLSLSIEKLENTMGEEQIRITLVDRLKLQEVEVCYAVNVTSRQSRQYHVKEAIVIALRQVVDKAVTSGLIDLTSRGVPTKLSTPLDTDFAG